MSNSLVRDGSFIVTPAVPYQPGVPAYTSYETFTGYRAGPPVRVGAWITIRVPRAGGGGTAGGYEERVIWDPNYSIASTVQYTYSVLTYHAAIPEVAGSASFRVDAPPQGWTSFANSILGTGNQAEAKFKVATGVVGVAVGLAPSFTPTAGYGHIPHGLVFTGNKVYDLKTGAYLTTYVYTDEFTIRAYAGIVDLKKNGSSLTTQAATYDARPLRLSAVLFAAKDRIEDPSIVSLGGGFATGMAIPSASIFGFQGAKGQALMAIPAVVLTSSYPPNNGKMTVPMAAMFGAEGVTHADSAMVVPIIDLSAYGGMLQVELRNNGDMTAEPATLVAHGITGEIGGALLMRIPQATMIGADRPYAAATMTAPAARMQGYTEDQDAGFLLELFLFDVSMVATTEADVQLPIVLSFDLRMTAAVAELPQMMRVDMALEMPMSAVADLTGELGILMLFDVPMTVPGTDVDVWCTNLANSGSTSYANYDFNSLARIGTRYFGAGAAGIFELDGDTDAGAPILATISLGSKDFGSPQKKTLAECYLAMKGTGPLQMRILAEDGDYTYVASGYSEHMKQQRVKFGKGLRTNYVTPVIYNDDEGSDFELDAILFGLADSQRKL